MREPQNVFPIVCLFATPEKAVDDNVDLLQSSAIEEVMAIVETSFRAVSANATTRRTCILLFYTIIIYYNNPGRDSHLHRPRRQKLIFIMYIMYACNIILFKLLYYSMVYCADNTDAGPPQHQRTFPRSEDNHSDSSSSPTTLKRSHNPRATPRVFGSENRHKLQDSFSSVFR